MADGLVRVEDGAGLTGALAVIQRRAPIHYRDAAARDAQLTPRVGDLVLLTATLEWAYWTGLVWAPFGGGDTTALEARVAALEVDVADAAADIAALTARVAALEAAPPAAPVWG